MNSKEVLLSYKRAVKDPHRLCGSCGEPLVLNDKKNRCPICLYLQENKPQWKKPIQTDAGYYLIFRSNLCKGHCTENMMAFYNRNQDYIYFYLKRIEERYPDFIDTMISFLNHEVLHYIFELMYRSKDEYHLDYRKASILLDLRDISQMADKVNNLFTGMPYEHPKNKEKMNNYEFKR